MFSETTESPLSNTSVSNLGGAEAAEIIIFSFGKAAPRPSLASCQKKAPALGGGARDNDTDAVTGPCALLPRRSKVSFRQSSDFRIPSAQLPRSNARAGQLPLPYYEGDDYQARLVSRASCARPRRPARAMR